MPTEGLHNNHGLALVETQDPLFKSREAHFKVSCLACMTLGFFSCLLSL